MIARLRAYAGLWTLAGLLGLVLVFVAAAAGPLVRHNEDRALRQAVAGAAWTARDLTLIGNTEDWDDPAGQFRDLARGLLPAELAGVTEVAWGLQRTQISRPSVALSGAVVTPGRSATVVGEGVTTEPDGFLPVVTLHHQTDLAPAIQLVEGAAPDTEPYRGSGIPVVEVMASTAAAGGLGLRAGQTYQLLIEAAPVQPELVAETDAVTVAIRVTGVFDPRDRADPVWHPDPNLLGLSRQSWPFGDQDVQLSRASLVTDQPGFDTLLGLRLTEQLDPQSLARIRLDESRLDAAWAQQAAAAVGELATDPRLRLGQPDELRLQTRLLQLVEEFQRQAAAAGAVTAVVVAGLVGTGIGLLLLAALVTVDRRRAELSLLRARGASRAAVVIRVVWEAVLVLVPAAVAGWLLHRLLPGRPDPELVPGVAAAPLAVAVVVLLAVPVAVAVVGIGRHQPAGRDDLVRYRSRPVRLTAELVVVLLAALGVWLLSERGLARAGTDPYLSAVPVLLGVACGLVALRLYPWPVRALGVLAARRRGVVGFLGLARAGRVTPAAALPLLVLVLAVAVGGFAAAVYQSVHAARDAAALRSVGADLRVEAGAELPPATVARVAAVPGVATVATAGDTGFVRVDGAPVQGVAVILVDAPEYQRVLAAIGAPGRLPAALVSAAPDSSPIPVLGTDPNPERELSVEIANAEYPVEVVGGVTDLPALFGGRDWLLLPAQALPQPPPVTELLIAGPEADPAAVLAATGVDPGATTVTTLAGTRAQLEGSGFNQALSLVFVVGTLGAALGGLLAVGLALAVQAAARGRALSLLRTMGLSTRQARGLLLTELVPVAVLAVAVGAAAGTAMPVLLAPALGLTEFTGGAPLPLALHPATAALLAGLLAVFVVGGALTEAALNRRLRLGQVTRFGG